MADGATPAEGGNDKDASGGQSVPPTRDPVLEALREILPQLEQSGVTELDVAVGASRLYVRRRPGPAPLAFAITPAQETVAEDEGLVAIVTPLSGVFYAAPAPGEAPYVQEGDVVEAGQVVALVEAMKVFNEIHAEGAGTVVKVLAAAAQVVQSGQTLMQIRPSESGPVVHGEAV